MRKLILMLGLLIGTTATQASEIPSSFYKVADTLVAVSIDTGVAVEHLATFAAIESTFRTNVANSNSSAVGLFQFTKRTWRTMLHRYGAQYGLSINASRNDPRANALMGAEYIKENRNILRKRLKREPTLTEIYTAHMLSPRRAVAVAKAPERYNAVTMYPNIAKVNSKYFYHRNGVAVSVGQLKGKFKAKVQGALAKYGNAAKKAKIAYHKAKDDYRQWTAELEVAMLNTCELETIPASLNGDLLRYTPNCKLKDVGSWQSGRLGPFTLGRRII